ncbi:hypothetical protein N0V85_009226 [Neurospora sp. IMI 360204]|nr:hypothetical protein N0V85_009226 [Neurospora sp. IMI 360204]
MAIQEATPEELEQWARELQDLNNQGHAPETPAQRAAGAVPQQPPSQDELMAFRDLLMNGQAPPQEIAPAAGQQFDIDPLAGLDLSPDNIMSEEELVAYATSQGFHIDANDLVQLEGAQNNNIEDQVMGVEVINDQPAAQPVEENANQQQEQENGAEEDQDLFDQYINLPNEGNNVDNENHDDLVDDDDLFADEYVENHGIDSIGSQDSTGTGSTGHKRRRDEVGEGDDGERAGQRARQN